MIQNSYASGTVSDQGTGTYVGDLVGENLSGATVESSYATGAVTSSGAEVGGLVGVNAGTLETSYSTGAVTASASGSDAGGLVGYNNAGTLSSAYALGAVSGSGFSAGGLVGKTVAGQVTGNYSTGAVSGGAIYAAGSIGYNSTYDVSGNYWDTQTSGQGTGVAIGYSSGATGLTTAQFGNSANFSAFSFTTTPDAAGWVIVDTDGTLNNAGGATGGTRPILASEYSTSISTGHQLQLAAMNLGAAYTLATNITLNDLTAADIWVNGFVPLGAGATHFTGSLSGNINGVEYYGITNLKINGTGNYVGLIGYNSGTVEYVFLGSVAVTGNAYTTGALVGWNDGTLLTDSGDGTVSGSGDHMGGLVGVNDSSGTITDVTSYVNLNASAYSEGGLVGYNGGTLSVARAQGNVTDEGYGGNLVGGLVGFNVHGTITNSVATGNVDGIGQAAGGLLGWNEGGTVTGSSSYGAVSGTASHLGGFAGVNNSGTLTTDLAQDVVTATNNNDAAGLVAYNTGVLSDDKAFGAVTGTAAAEGGLVGWNTNTGGISVSLATGAVTDTNPSSHAGGLVGVDYGGSVTEAYAIGAVTGDGVSAGGLIGYNMGIVEQTYAVGAVSGSAADIGGLAGFNEGTFLSSYWDTTATKQSAGVGVGSAGGVTGKTTAGLQTSTVPTGFNGSDWVVNLGSYPYLKALGDY